MSATIALTFLVLGMPAASFALHLGEWLSGWIELNINNPGILLLLAMILMFLLIMAALPLAIICLFSLGFFWAPLYFILHFGFGIFPDFITVRYFLFGL